MMIPITKQTRVFDPKGNETYVIARQADLTSLLWTITQTLSWTELTRLSRNDRTDISSIADTTPQQAQMVTALLAQMVSLKHLPYENLCPKMKRHWAPTAFKKCPVMMDAPFCGRPRKPRPLRHTLYSSTHRYYELSGTLLTPMLTCDLWVYVHLVSFPFRPYMMKRHKKDKHINKLSELIIADAKGDLSYCFLQFQYAGAVGLPSVTTRGREYPGLVMKMIFFWIFPMSPVRDPPAYSDFLRLLLR
ncbi:hypothetical protein PCH_Pc22g05770 [Penicillium rubens Wisconsin 54-1255]|uniref:Uncharacterized protein n=1 Tax=Penicillium rubens (strain ATCC 28089 / DSM 1075 / NRRL 1951 / Wisconsin 54-1255) TaxID=500485 RepID=B6HV66_PENRW|nr:hypothetical protein PCH_Pc22g05770 [Penicillium rubens Wisconsin 54-1255]